MTNTNTYLYLNQEIIQKIKIIHLDTYKQYASAWNTYLNIQTFDELCQLTFNDLIQEEYILNNKKASKIRTKYIKIIRHRKKAWYKIMQKKLATVDKNIDVRSIQQQLDTWYTTKESKLYEYVNFSLKCIPHQIRAFKLELACTICDILIKDPDILFKRNSIFNTAIQTETTEDNEDSKIIEITRPKNLINSPIYSPNKSKLKFSKKKGTNALIDEYKYAEGCSIITLIDDLETKLKKWPFSLGKKPIDASQLYCLDIKDAMIVDYIIKQINITHFIATNGRVDIYLTDLVKAIYKNPTGAAYEDIKKRLFQLHCYTLTGEGVDFNGEGFKYSVSFFDIVEYTGKKEIDSEIQNKENNLDNNNKKKTEDNKKRISLYFSTLLKEAFISGVTISITQQQKEKLERSPANLILHSLNLERIHLGIQAVKDKSTTEDGYTKEYPYIYFLHQFRFSHNNKTKQKAEIKKALDDLIEQKYLIKNAEMLKKSVKLTFYPLTAKEIKNLGIREAPININTYSPFSLPNTINPLFDIPNKNF